MTLSRRLPDFELRLARDGDDLRAAQRLRYRVFVQELGAAGPMVDHAEGTEADARDAHCDHLLLLDRGRAPQDRIVGVYRLLPEARATRAGGFYSEAEYDLAPLRATGRPLLEFGRSCLHPDYRGGPALFHLWQGLADYVSRTGAEILFGVASFHGTDPQALAGPLSHLHHLHLAPPDLRVRSRVHQPMDLLAPGQVDRLAALRATPALIKAYLRLGGVVGDGAFIDRDFNTTDVCLLLDTARLPDRARRMYAGAERSLD